jgi:hypothetical protein
LSIDTSSHPATHRRVTLSPVLVQSAYTTTTTAQKGSPQQKSPVKPTPAYELSSPTDSPRKSPVKEIDCSPDTSGLLSSMILRKRTSVAYFIDLMGPTKVSQMKVQIEQDGEVSTPRSPTKESSPTKHTQPLSAPLNQTSYFQFPKIRPHMFRPLSPELANALQSKLNQASKRRTQHLHLRRLKLQRHFQSLKLKLLLHDSRIRLDKLRMQAQSELNHSVAELNRQMYLRKKREELETHTEHVRRVMILTKMKKMMNLRRALSESFCELLKEDVRNINDSDALSSLGSEFTRGLRVEIPQEEYDMQPLKIDIPSEVSPETAYNSSPNPKRVGVYAADLDSYLFRTHSPVDSMLATIRRTKSLPHLVLTDSSDTVFIELLNLLPPITRFTLRELDMDEVLSNAQLRHDILFDQDLQFKTSTEDDDVDEEEQGMLYRVPLLVSEIRAILIELLPNGDEIKEEIASHLDAHLINQQLEHGIMNPYPIFEYISGLMKTNCAPIRDVFVDEMLAECEKGKVVKALKLCFDVLELMKLVWKIYVGLCKPPVG